MSAGKRFNGAEIYKSPNHSNPANKKINNSEAFCMVKLTKELDYINPFQCKGCDGRNQFCSPRKGEIKRMDDYEGSKENEISEIIYFAGRLVYNDSNKGLEENSSGYRFLFIS